MSEPEVRMVNVACWFAGVSRPAREVGKGEGSLVVRGNFSRLIAVRLDAPGTRAEDGVATFAASYRASRRARERAARRGGHMELALMLEEHVGESGLRQMSSLMDQQKVEL